MSAWQGIQCQIYVGDIILGLCLYAVGWEVVMQLAYHDGEQVHLLSEPCRRYFDNNNVTRAVIPVRLIVGA